MLDFLDRFLKKYSNVNFQENPSNGSRVIACGQTDMTKLIVADCNFANTIELMPYGEIVAVCSEVNT